MPKLNGAQHALSNHAPGEPGGRACPLQARGARGAAPQPQAPPTRLPTRSVPSVVSGLDRSSLPTRVTLSTPRSDRSTSSPEEIDTIERDLANFVLNSPDARRLLTVPGLGMITGAVFLAQTGTARGDNQSLRVSGGTRRLGRVGPACALVRQRPRAHRPDFKGGRRGRPGCPRRVRPDRRALTRAAARLLPSHPRSPRSPDRDHRDRTQTRQAVLAPPYPQQNDAYTPVAKKIHTIELKAGHLRRRPGANHQTLNRESTPSGRAPDCPTSPGRLRKHDRRLAPPRPRRCSRGVGAWQRFPSVTP